MKSLFRSQRNQRNVFMMTDNKLWKISFNLESEFVDQLITLTKSLFKKKKRNSECIIYLLFFLIKTNSYYTYIYNEAFDGR